jgi:hypothetical protein
MVNGEWVKAGFYPFTIYHSLFTLFVPVSDPAFGQIVGGHFNLHAVAGENADEIFAHLAADLRQHDVLAVIQTDTEEGVGQFIYYDALGRNKIIFSQTKSPLVKSSAPVEGTHARALPEVGERV